MLEMSMAARRMSIKLVQCVDVNSAIADPNFDNNDSVVPDFIAKVATGSQEATQVRFYQEQFVYDPQEVILRLLAAALCTKEDFQACTEVGNVIPPVPRKGDEKYAAKPDERVCYFKRFNESDDESIYDSDEDY
jgi:hypothetical protein